MDGIDIIRHICRDTYCLYICSFKPISLTCKSYVTTTMEIGNSNIYSISVKSIILDVVIPI